MKNLNNTKMICLLIVCLSFTVKSSEKRILIEYLDYENFGGSFNIKMVYMKIKNNTKDTLFLSGKNILIKVLKNNKQLKDKGIKTIGQIHFNPKNINKERLKNQELQEKETNTLRRVFAENLFYKNFGNNSKYKNDRESIISSIENLCIVILPNKDINYAKIFNNSLFDKTCKVEIEYSNNNNRFTYFVDENGKKIEIYN